MSDDRGNKRTVSICLAGFRTDPGNLRQYAGEANFVVHRIGNKRGHSQVFDKNFAAFWLPMNACESWTDHITELVGRMGGWTNVRRLITDLSAENAWIRIDAPALGSPYVESNSLSLLVIREMAASGLSLDLGIGTFDAHEPTHHPIDHGNGQSSL